MQKSALTVGTSKARAPYAALPCRRLGIIALPWAAQSLHSLLKGLLKLTAQRILLPCRCRNSGVFWKVSLSKNPDVRQALACRYGWMKSFELVIDKLKLI